MKWNDLARIFTGHINNGIYQGMHICKYTFTLSLLETLTRNSLIKSSVVHYKAEAEIHYNQGSCMRGYTKKFSAKKCKNDTDI